MLFEHVQVKTQLGKQSISKCVVRLTHYCCHLIYTQEPNLEKDFVIVVKKLIVSNFVKMADSGGN